MVNMPAYAVPLPPPAPLPVSFGSEPPPMARTRLAPDALPDWMFEDEYQEEAINHMITLEVCRCAPLCFLQSKFRWMANQTLLWLTSGRYCTFGRYDRCTASMWMGHEEIPCRHVD